MQCCVIGGTGFVGSRLVARLANAGYRVTVPTRDPERCRHLRVLPTLRVLRADIHAPEMLRGILEGADTAINLVGILNEPGRDGAGFRRAHVELTQKLIGACSTAGVRHLVQISALNATSPDRPDPGTSHYLRSKGEAEAVLRASGLNWTILQPSVVFGPGDSFLNRFAGLLRSVPLAFPLAMPGARFAPVHVDDVVEAIIRVLDQPAAFGHTFQLYGPETYTLRELVELVAETMGLRRRVIGLPRSLSRLQAAVMDYVPGKPFSTDNYRSLLTDSVGSADGLQQLGIRPRALRPNLTDALRGAGLTGIMDSYRKTAGR
ncbi:MAG: complex I NDUFA9 subunit family protein [Gammaproteobacteria bacterium]|nr:complex I NDUFA9 subunit family protein [Gammaproteobacteria bacterium]